MNKSFIKKLNVIVDNNNLPILEPMSQFTLDAITKSGNASMSDEQKFALNHFFYQIGAIGGNGIASKLDVLYLPLICNKNVNKAIIDYIGDYTIDSSDYIYTPVFSGNGIVSDDLTNKRIKGQLYYDSTCQACTAIVGTAPKKSIITISNIISNEYPTSFNILGVSNTGSVLRILNNEVECQYPNIQDGTTVALLTRNGTNDYSSKVINNGVIHDTYEIVSASSPVSAPNEHRYAITLRNLPVKVIAFGSPLTDTEERIAVEAINELQIAFPDPE